MTWTVEREDVLKKLWADGLSASQIAVELGSVTRNSVIGKVHRLGLSGRMTTGARSARPRKPSIWVPRSQRPSSNRVFNTTFAPQVAVVDAPVEPELLEIPVAQRKTLLQLDERTCHWPVGDPSTPDFFYCGGESVPDHPYCSFHCRVAFAPRHAYRRGFPVPGGAAA